jgi:hypothetical protein
MLPELFGQHGPKRLDSLTLQVRVCFMPLGFFRLAELIRCLELAHELCRFR